VETLLAKLARTRILTDQARWPLAVEEAEAVLALAEPNLDRRPWRWAQAQLVFLYDKVGRLGAATALGERALREGSAEVGDAIAARLLDNLAGVYLELDRIEEAATLQQRAQALYVALYGPDHEAALSGASNLATVLWEIGRRDEVIALEREVVERRRQIGSIRLRNALIGRNLLAEHLLALGRLDEAEQEMRSALPVWVEKFGADYPETLDVRYHLSLVAIERGRWDEAHAELERICPLYEQIGDTYEGAPRSCPMELARTLWHVGQRERALRMLGEALTAFEQRIETGRLSDRSAQSFFAYRMPMFRRWAEWLVATGRRDEAFAVSERLRARSLLQSIVLRHADASPALPADEAARLARLKAKLAQLDQAASGEDDAARRVLLGAERDQAFRELAELRGELGRRYPAYAALSAVRIVAPAEATRLLAADTAAVTYLAGDERLYALLLAPRRPLQALDLGPLAGLREAVDAAHALLGGDGTRRVWRWPDGRLEASAMRPAPEAIEVTDWQVPARELGRRLLAPVAQRLRGVGHWIVVPDGPLAQLPFEALLLDDRPLAATVEVRYVQSMSVLAAMQARPPRAAGKGALLSVGAPDFPPAAEPSGAAEKIDLAALVRGIDDPGRAARRAYDLLRLQWPPLPGAAAEIARVQAVFAGRMPAQALTGPAASEPTMQRMERTQALRRFRYVHVATHGYLSPRVPALSAIVLSPAEVGPGADGYLTAAELPAYHFDSDLIVLSACETGRGTELAGEGIMGLPYALFVAGNRSAVLTLWKVSDASAARFVGRFFEQVAGGATPAAALTWTKREFMRGVATAHPLHWAGFVLYGS
jgi:CHAT domain-containing protein/tetratricopeptide (TPR) repeat protein